MGQYRIADLCVQFDYLGVAEDHAKEWAINDLDSVDCDDSATSIFIPETNNQQLAYLRSESEFSKYLIEHDGFILHSSALRFGDRAYCFCGPSGVGKSTHAALWQSYFGIGIVEIINDDKPAIRKIDGTWYVYGTPWAGKEMKSLNKRCKLGAIVLLQQGTKNELTRINDIQKISAICSAIPGPMDAHKRYRLLSLIAELINTIPIIGFECRADVDAVKKIYQYLEQERGIK